jgi:hypothetical protein
VGWVGLGVGLGFRGSAGKWNSKIKHGTQNEGISEQNWTMTSLQRAVVAAKESKPQYETSNGAFETCFAGGLDLSEFSNPSSSLVQPGKSAAAELLRVKAKERNQREEEEAAERRMEEIIKQGVSNLEQSLKKTPRPSIVVDALVKMHGSDTSESLYRGKKSRQRKSGSSRNNASSSKAYKKSKKSKY